MTRDRLGEFKKKRLHASFRNSFRRPSHLDTENEDVIKVQETVKEIQKDIEQTQSKTKELGKLYSEIVTTPFAAPEKMEKAQKLNDEIRLHANLIGRKLRRLDKREDKKEINMEEGTDNAEFSSLCPKSGNSALGRLCKTQFVLYSSRLSSVIEELNTTELAFRSDMKRRLRRQMSIAGARMTDAELDQKVDEDLQGSFQVFTQDIVTDFDAARKRKEELKACLKQKECLLSLEYNIREMHTLFQDMAFLIGRQGEVVDSIECHVQRTASYVESGKTQLTKATVHRKRNRKFKLLIIFLVLLIVLISFCVALGIFLFS